MVQNTLKSPGYPSNYPNNMDCEYSVPISHGGPMGIYFDDFDLEFEFSCRWDSSLYQEWIFFSFASSWSAGSRTFCICSESDVFQWKSRIRQMTQQNGNLHHSFKIKRTLIHVHKYSVTLLTRNCFSSKKNLPWFPFILLFSLLESLIKDGHLSSAVPHSFTTIWLFLN